MAEPQREQAGNAVMALVALPIFLKDIHQIQERTARSRRGELVRDPLGEIAGVGIRKGVPKPKLLVEQNAKHLSNEAVGDLVEKLQFIHARAANEQCDQGRVVGVTALAQGIHDRGKRTPFEVSNAQEWKRAHRICQYRFSDRPRA